ncbi:uncharacterized protein LOC119737162 [Patiria miniata]|uniref:Uncharacterized protein n=1 Tax=Patiria miniata TaxID=46514 RepID=A0A914AVA0_PATMI|nr:uncharacterized protein LOC119737162 [Patiria miniata]
MVEGSLRSYDPLAYHVNNLEDIKPEVVRAHRQNNGDEIKRLLAQGDPSDYDVFICVNSGWHAFVLCVPANEVTPKNDPMNVFQDMPTDDPFAIPNQLLVWETELCFESEEQRMYKIRFKLSMFGELKPKIKRSFYIGKYKQVPVSGLQFAILRASPKRYKVLLDDCVEFAKTFCYELLSFSGNGREIEKSVEERLVSASGSGLSVEVLSRRIQSSALLGNTFLGGVDASAFLSAGRRPAVIICLVLFLVLYPIVVPLLVCYMVMSMMTSK